MLWECLKTKEEKVMMRSYYDLKKKRILKKKNINPIITGGLIAWYSTLREGADEE